MSGEMRNENGGESIRENLLTGLYPVFLTENDVKTPRIYGTARVASFKCNKSRALSTLG